MPNSPPQIDSRDAAQIAETIRSRLSQTFPTWQEAKNPATGQPQGLSAALIAIFARYSEVVIQRLNQVPQKNFLAFLNLLGASRLPPQPARVPLTFFLATGSIVEGVVPARTQVAAPPAEGEKDPVIFETERELVVTAARLASIYVRNPDTDLVGDYGAIATANIAANGTAAVFAFQGNQAIEHHLYIAHDVILSYPNLKALRLTVTLTIPAGNTDQRENDQPEVRWEYWDGSQYQPITPVSDETQQLSQNGNIIFGNPALDNDAAVLPEFKSHTVHQIEKRWLRCRLLTPINHTERSLTGMVRAKQLPTITGVNLQPTLQERDLLIEHAFTNQIPIDLSKDFFPFGEQPKLGDTFFLASQPVFSKKLATITLTINLTLLNDIDEDLNKEENRGELARFKKVFDQLELTWEYWNGKTWIAFGTSTKAGRVPRLGVTSLFQDQTNAFTESGAGKEIKFVLPNDATPTTVNGIDSDWIRVRISQGNYGVDSKYVPAKITVGNTTLDTFTFRPAWFKAPLIHRLTAGYQISPTNPPPPESLPEVVLTHNDGKYDVVSPVESGLNRVFQTFQPFQKTAVEYPTLYLGFTLPAGRSRFPNRPLTLFCRTADVNYGDRALPVSPLYSRRARTNQSVVTHFFQVMNAVPFQAGYRVSVFGTTWATDDDAGAVDQNGVQIITVQVAIPEGAQLTDRDRGFLKLTRLQAPFTEFIATFETVASQELPPLERLHLQWEYWNGQDWKKLTVRDAAENFTRSGLIEFLPPADFALKPPERVEFGLGDRYWLRVQWQKGQAQIPPKLRGLWLNTTTATQTVTIRNEILGSSDGTENQRFRTTRSPILDSPQLQVRELELPSATEQTRIRTEEGDDSITEVRQSNGQLQEVWVRWHEVPDFYASGARDRHYVLDHLTGEIQFGNGINGMIPPIEIGNLRLSRYYTGGGETGNRAAGAIVQLKTTVPYVDKVINPEPATGGAEAETLDSLRDRVPRTIRHGNRAVTPTDYEDLAMLASPAVARAKCVPLRNLSQEDSSANLAPFSIQGNISVIIVPHSIDLKPLPSLELTQRVQDYLTDHAPVSATIAVVGAQYVQVRVTVDIALVSLEGASAVEQTVYQTLTRFLHPLTGGFNGTGWTFGRKPHKSDFYALIESIPGVDHIHSLSVDPDRDPPSDIQAILNTNRFLVYSGTHQVTLRQE